MKRIVSIALLVFVFFSMWLAISAQAATSEQENVLKLQAAAAFMKRDFRSAEALYTRVLNHNPDSIEANVQRAQTRRELQNISGMRSDAARALSLIDVWLQQTPNDSDLYYQRSLTHRLLGNFDAAENDVRRAYRLGHSGLMDTDLKAIALERKMAQ